MALILKDRVKESTTVTSTGTATLLGAATGYQSFSAIGNGNTCYYTIASQTANEWEVGLGTYTSPDQLSRDTVLSSSNSGSLVNFSAGTKDVFVAQPAEEAVYVSNATGKVEANGNGANTISFTNINTTNLTANTVTVTAGTISTNAANATDITNKTYVDGLFSTGISFHDPVLVEEDVALVAVYNQPNGAANGVGATLTNNAANVALVVDGVSVSNTARILVYAQANAVQNGVYTVTNPGNASAQWVLTRATDADTFGLANPNQLGQGDAFFVTDGDTGAGRTYICNTPGTITFGTTNITFAEISSSQIYAAGTGLNLANLTFSISNTAVTAAQYGNDGAVGQFTVNAQGQITNAANVSINASSISVGTLANGRTTAASANGASTIVARDANGSFAGNVITATTSNATTFNGTTGSFTNVSGNGVALTAINASNVTSGTLANARTTASDANGASTIVSRDANGSFGANIVTATFSGNGASISAINASNISSGTIANARTTASSSNGASTIVQRDSGGNFSANTVTAAVIGDLSGGSNINASNIASGTIANARTTASSANGASTIVLRGASGEFAAGAITGTSFSGNGSALTAINATAITTGTIDNARTTAASANGASTIVARDANGSFSGNVITGTTGTFTNISGNGTSLTAINASNISSGTIANARTTGTDAATAATLVLRDANGSFSGNVITATNFSGGGGSISAINASNISSGTIANARTTAATANGASTIVLRGTSGEFSAGAITGASFTGDGAAISAINASNVSTGTIANARTTGASANGASTLVLRDANGSFAGNVITGTTGTFTNISGNGVSLTAINASNITSGTIANARTTASDANGASTIIARDANGSFAANVVSAATGSFTAVSGNGVALTAINASNISSGTIANARTTAASANGASTIVTRDASGDFSARTITANLTGTATTATTANALNTGNGYTGTSFTAAQAAPYLFVNRTSVSSGQMGIQFQNAGTTIWWNYLEPSSTTMNWYQGSTNTVVMSLTTTGALTATSFTGNGAAISAINASNLSSGTVATARLATGTANASTYLRGDQTWATITAGVTITNDTTTNASYYPVFTTATSGTISAANVSSTELIFNPGTNELTAPVVTASYGMHMNPATLSTSYTIPANYNSVSAGPVTIANAVTITVSTGSAWVVV
jgi:trimeric autotransporter adhesin